MMRSLSMRDQYRKNFCMLRTSDLPNLLGQSHLDSFFGVSLLVALIVAFPKQEAVAITRNATDPLWVRHADGTPIHSQRADSSRTIFNRPRNSKRFSISLAYPQNPGRLLTEILGQIWKLDR